MNTVGKVIVDNVEYFLYLNDLKASEKYFLFSKQHIEDRIKMDFNIPDSYPTIKDSYTLYEQATLDYLLQGYKRMKLSNKCSDFRNSDIIEKIIARIYHAKMYSFSKNSVIDERYYTDGSSRHYYFSAEDGNLSYTLHLVDNLIAELHIREVGFTLDLSSEIKKRFKLFSDKDIVFKEVSNSDLKRLTIFTVKDVSFSDVRRMLDLSWYIDENDNKKLIYEPIYTIKDFELKIVREYILESLEAKRQGRSAKVLALDSETTGFGMYNLSSDNDLKDHTVALPICFDNNKAYLVFLDMAHFENISTEYVVRRLTELFEMFEGEREYTYYEELVTENSLFPEKDIQLNDITVFDDVPTEKNSVQVAESYTDLSSLKPVTVKITRNMFNLVGHNALFDKKVMYAEAVQIYNSMSRSVYFNNDTLQMAFILNPGYTKHSRALKPLTKRLLGFESPDLTAILGRGNEDKFRYLKDLDVALLYGCSDALFTYRIFFILRKLMGKNLYTKYQHLDMEMINILGISEYYGLPIDGEQMKVLADRACNDIETLKTLMYRYVGGYLEYNNSRAALDVKYKSGSISLSEYEAGLSKVTISPNALFSFEMKPNRIRNVLYDILKYPKHAYTTGKNPLPKVDKFVMAKLAKEKLKDGENPMMALHDHIYADGYTADDYAKMVAKKGEKKAAFMLLIDKNEFNSAKYPLALALQKYGDLNKEYTSYFKPMLDNNLEGKIFKNYSLARIETRRIMNPSQTMKGALKALVHAYTKEYYMIDFDMSQVEYRIMLSIAQFIDMINVMNHPEKDYHVETAALVNFCKPHRVSKDMRKKTKNVSFGVPYGLGLAKLCERMFGVINDVTRQATQALLNKWQKANKPVMDMLNKNRDKALIAEEISIELRDFLDMWERDSNNEFILDAKGERIPIPVGFVRNEYGFYRIFNLKDVDKDDGKKAKIRNAAGNFPIQCFAAELFREILINFYNRCTKEGIQDKIIWHMLIHDELLLSCHKSIHPFFMYKIIKEECMISPPGHTNYFVGINIGMTWADTKDDAREAPVLFVNDIVERWDAGEFKDAPTWFDDPWEYIKPYRAKYVQDRIGRVLREEAQHDIDTAPIDIQHVLEHFSNYTVRAYVYDYDTAYKIVKDYNPADPGAEELYEDEVWASRLEQWAIEYYGEDKLILDFHGELRKVGSKKDKPKAKVITELAEPIEIDFDALDMDVAMDMDVDVDLDVDMALDVNDFSELFEDDIHVTEYWDFDGTAMESYYDDAQFYGDSRDYSQDDEPLTIVEEIDSLETVNKNATNVGQLVGIKLQKYDNLTVTTTKVIANVKSKKQETLVRQFVQANKAIKGYSVAIKTFNGSFSIVGTMLQTVDLAKLDELLK